MEDNAFKKKECEEGGKREGGKESRRVGKYGRKMGEGREDEREDGRKGERTKWRKNIDHHTREEKWQESERGCKKSPCNLNKQSSVVLVKRLHF